MLATKSLSAAAAESPAYVDDVFVSYLRTGTGADVTVTNNIDMTEGYLLWTKGRSGATDHAVYDSGRGVTKDLVTNSTAAETTQSTGLKAVSGTGYTIGSLAKMNTSSATYVDWVFRKAPKFFDVVTYTGNGTTQNISHSLGSVPGMIIIKATSVALAWPVWHRSLATNHHLRLNTTDASFAAASYVSGVSTTTFSVGSGSQTNDSGVNYVAYLFAHDAGGFGDTGDQNVVSCGSFTSPASGSTTTVTLGWEPQYVLIKSTENALDWRVSDNMRGMSLTGYNTLKPNTSEAEEAYTDGFVTPTATGFIIKSGFFGLPNNYIYLAIRRGPMKTPTVGTSVYNPSLGATATPAFTSSFPVDLAITSYRAGGGGNNYFVDRLRGQRSLESPNTAVEGATFALWKLDQQTGFSQSNGGWDTTQVCSMFRRAPGFFDVVCYTGTGAARTVNHNLGVAPELMIVKNRSSATNWTAYSSALGGTKWLQLNGQLGELTNSSIWNDTNPTSSVITVGTAANTNSSGSTYVAYLFATVPNVSKVGSYTGTGTTQQINCGFTTGARFVLIKATSTTGNWLVWDAARGIISGNDPYLALNSTAAEVTNTDWVDPLASGFELSNVGGNLVNTNAVSYIFLAVA